MSYLAHRESRCFNEVFIFFMLIQALFTRIFLRNIEIWENQGSTSNPDYTHTVIEDSDFQNTGTYDYGEIILFDHSQCNNIPKL